MTDDGVRVFAFCGRDLLVREDGGARVLGGGEWDAMTLPAVRAIELGALDGVPCRAVELSPDEPLPRGTVLRGLRALHGVLDAGDFRRAVRAVQIVEWDRSHQFCGRCGHATERVPGEFARACPVCAVPEYPRLSPAVIVRIERGDEILLARGPATPPGMYSTLAGFVEPGESLEEAVVREVREEVGVELADVRYFGSQPWPFPHSLMIGFTASYAGGELTPQEGEIEHAAWFTPHAMPAVTPSRISIARALIDDWLARRGVTLP
jgi:NAD+ diphosphatase